MEYPQASTSLTDVALFCMTLDMLEETYVAIQTEDGTWVLLMDGDVWHFCKHGKFCCHATVER